MFYPLEHFYALWVRFSPKQKLIFDEIFAVGVLVNSFPMLLRELDQRNVLTIPSPAPLEDYQQFRDLTDELLPRRRSLLRRPCQFMSAHFLHGLFVAKVVYAGWHWAGGAWAKLHLWCLEVECTGSTNRYIELTSWIIHHLRLAALTIKSIKLRSIVSIAV